MADKTKYYYLKIKENFFDTEDMKLLESMENGYLYSNILMKMYLLSLKHGGELIYKERIPYNSKMLATILNHNIAIVEKAIKIFEGLDLIEILDSGAIFMLDIQNYIGKSSDEADRKRQYRNRIETTKQIQMDKCPDKSTTNCSNIRDIDRDIVKDKDIIKDRGKDRDIIYNVVLETTKNVISKLNELNNTKFKYKSDNNIKLIKARLDEGYTQEDLIMVVEKMSYLWNKEPKKGEKDMRVYLRPSTLFRKSNFENYLNMPTPRENLTIQDISKSEIQRLIEIERGKGND